jgi:hypothetical protein
MSRLILTVCHVLVIMAISTTSASAGVVTLAWNANPEPDIAGYVVAYGTSPGNHPLTVDVGNRTTWQLPGLVSGQRYYFVVRAYNTAGLMSPPSSEVDTNVLAVFLTSNISPLPAIGQPINWVAAASSGVLTEYRFWRFSAGAWSLVQDYSPLNSYTWTPTAGDVGAHQVQVWARVQGSSRNYNAWDDSGLFSIQSGSVVIGSLESSVALPAATGTAMTWKARAVGGPGPIQYKFWRYKEGSGWTMVRDYSASDSYTWTPGPGDQGPYSLQVWARPNGSSAQYTTWRQTNFEVVDMAPAIGSIVPSVGSPSGTGTSISWRVNASGGPQLEYAFWRFSPSGTWTLVQDYGPSNTFTWTPGTGEQGAYALQVWVRRFGAGASYEAWKGLPFTVADAVPVVKSLKADSALPIGSGTPVTWRAEASGGPGPFEYKFWLNNLATDSWSALTEYGPSDRYTWTPRAGDAGSYIVQVWIRRQGSTAGNYAAYRSTEVFTVADAVPSIAAITPDVTENLTPGMPITWTALAAGGPGPLEYQFLRYDANRGSWSIAQDYSWDNTYSWVPKASERGSHTIQVRVRRFGSAASFEGWLQAPAFAVN